MPVMVTAQGETVEEFVYNAAQTLVKQLGKNPFFLNLMMIEIVEFKASHVSRLVGKFVPLIMPLVEKMGSLKGELRQMHPFVLARAFLGMFFSYYITEALMGRAMPPGTREHALEQFVEIFLHGILIKESQ
jgi:hypothetical protein